MKAFPILTLGFLCCVCQADSTIDSSNKYSYSSGGGWLNWRWNSFPVDGAVVCERYLSGLIYSASYGWIQLGDGDPSNGHSYSQSNSDFGVNHDGEGLLTGMAYGANIGWISFDWSGGGNVSEPKIDLSTGRFSGFAYGSNVGWIKLDATASAFLETDGFECPDSDSDGIADWWERQNGGNLTRYSATSDRDGDGASDRDEYFALTDPESSSDFLLVSSSYSAGGTSYTVTFPSNSGRRYLIETGVTLNDWEDSGLGSFTPDEGSSTSKVVTIPGSDVDVRRFFRVVPSVPLAQ